MYLRYRLVDELNRDANHVLARCNQFAWALAIVSTFGLSIVANFQVHSHELCVSVNTQENAVRAVHLTGAFACFGAGAAYCCLHAYITCHMHPLYTGRRICYIRTIIAVLCTGAYFTGALINTTRHLFIVLAITCGILASVTYHSGGAVPSPDPAGTPHTHWHTTDPVRLLVVHPHADHTCRVTDGTLRALSANGCRLRR
jgi:hypothetical protein